MFQTSFRFHFTLFFIFFIFINLKLHLCFSLQITEKCLPHILQLQHLEDLILEGCLGIDDEGLVTLKHSCKSLKVHFICLLMFYISFHNFRTLIFSNIQGFYLTKGNHIFPPCPIFSDSMVNVHFIKLFYFIKILSEIIRATLQLSPLIIH